MSNYVPTSLYEKTKDTLFKNVGTPTLSLENWARQGATPLYNWLEGINTDPGDTSGAKDLDQKTADSYWQLWRNMQYGQQYGYGQDQSYYDNNGTNKNYNYNEPYYDDCHGKYAGRLSGQNDEIHGWH